jgi:hypothetical protein
MKKLTLQVDALTVESFPTGGANGPVEALLATRPGVCDPVTNHPRCPVY